MVRKLRVGGSQTRFDGSQTQRRFADFAWQVWLHKGSSTAMCWLHSLHTPPIVPTLYMLSPHPSCFFWGFSLWAKSQSAQRSKVGLGRSNRSRSCKCTGLAQRKLWESVGYGCPLSESCGAQRWEPIFLPPEFSANSKSTARTSDQWQQDDSFEEHFDAGDWTARKDW